MELHYKNLSLDDIVYIDDDGVHRIEEWRDVPDYEGLYQVSNLGRVKSLSREMNKGNGYFVSKDKILIGGFGINGYRTVSLSLKNKTKTITVHQLVAIAFWGHKRCGYKLVIDHINNNPKDNSLFNLQTLTNRENSSKDKKNGTSKYVGVSYINSRKKWMSTIKINGKQINLGRFNNELEASSAYQNKLKQVNRQER